MGRMPEKCTVRKWNSQSYLEVSFFFSCQYSECENSEDNFSYFFPVLNVWNCEYGTVRGRARETCGSLSRDGHVAYNKNNNNNNNHNKNIARISISQHRISRMNGYINYSF